MNLYAEIKEKRTILRELYGGMMSLRDLSQELGTKSKDATRNAVQDMGLPATQVGRMKKYDTDEVAKLLVEREGMSFSLHDI